MGKIIHIVLWKLAAPPSTIVSSAELALHQTQIKAKFQALLSVPGVLEGHVGEPKIADRAKGFDFGFYSVFESMEALQKYAVSDEHMKIVVNDIRPNVQDVLAYDFELP